MLAGPTSALAVMCRSRVEMGAETYGGLSLSTDKRDFAKEFMQEIADALYYAQALAEQLHTSRFVYTARKVGRVTALLCTAFEIMEKEDG